MPRECQNTDWNDERLIEQNDHDSCIYTNINTTSSIGQFGVFRGLGTGFWGKVYIGQYKPEKKLIVMKVFEESILQKYKFNMNYLIADIACAWYQENMFVELKCAFYRKGYLTMISEYMPGGNLKVMLDQKSNFEEDEIRHYIARLALALRH